MAWSGNGRRRRNACDRRRPRWNLDPISSLPAPPRAPGEASCPNSRRASFDRKTGEVSGSGAGIGNPESAEDYDDDISVGSGSDRRTGGPSNAA